MKQLILLVFVAFCGINVTHGLPRYNHQYSDTFRPCQDVDALQTLWPDFDDNTIFHQCVTIGFWGLFYQNF